MSDPEIIVHTAAEALARFALINGRGDGEHTACVMSAVSWMAGESFTDSPRCAHRNLTTTVIGANDAPGTTPEQRAEILRAGETGLLDTWWIPGLVIAHAVARPKPAEGEVLPDETPVDRVLRVLAYVAAWKEHRARPSAVLRYAVLSGAVLRDADLRDADLSGAVLRDADLRGAVLRYADLSGADLRDADLSDADLRGADLRGADLRDAYLSGADLRYAVLRGAVLRGAYLRDADLRYACGTPFGGMPTGWKLNDNGLWVKA
jgi:hypothetical protein